MKSDWSNSVYTLFYVPQLSTILGKVRLFTHMHSSPLLSIYCNRKHKLNLMYMLLPDFDICSSIIKWQMVSNNTIWWANYCGFFSPWKIYLMVIWLYNLTCKSATLYKFIRYWLNNITGYSIKTPIYESQKWAIMISWKHKCVHPAYEGTLTHLPTGRNSRISKTTVSSAFSWMKIYSVQISPKFVPKGSIDNSAALFR